MREKKGIIVYSRNEDGTWAKIKLVKVPGEKLPHYIPMKPSIFEIKNGYSKAIAKEWGL